MRRIRIEDEAEAYVTPGIEIVESDLSASEQAHKMDDDEDEVAIYLEDVKRESDRSSSSDDDDYWWYTPEQVYGLEADDE